LRGSFTARTSATEWCERRLLARIHRYTVQRLRREIEPVSAADYMRFLIDWQHLGETRMHGPNGLVEVLDQIEGFEAQAAAWERDILPARVVDYDPQALDNLCRSGRFLWMRRRAPRAAGPRRPSPISTTPIAFLARRNLGAWTALADGGEPETLDGSAHCVA